MQRFDLLKGSKVSIQNVVKPVMTNEETRTQLMETVDVATWRILY